MDLLELFLEFVLHFVDATRAWRFLSCVALATAAIVSINSVVQNRVLCLALTVPIGVAGVVQGIIWELRRR